MVVQNDGRVSQGSSHELLIYWGRYMVTNHLLPSKKQADVTNSLDC